MLLGECDDVGVLMDTASVELTQDQQAVGLRAALRVLDGWGATNSQVCSILRISVASHQRVLKNSGAAIRLDKDQQQRVSLVLNIHASLRNIFENADNVRGFPSFKNTNAFFEGRSPLEVMAQGDLISLYETHKHIDQLRWSHWA